MLHIDAIKAAGEEFVSAALLGEGWEAALSHFSHAAGARGAAIMRNRDYRVIGVLASPEIDEQVTQFMAGRVPPSSRQQRTSHDLSVGFRFDYDDYSTEELARDAYYQEFLRPSGYFWHAVTGLSGKPGEQVALSLKRPLKFGHYERRDAAVLDRILPELRAAVRIAREVMDAEGRGIARLLQRRGAPLFELDCFGGVLRAHVFTDDGGCPIRVRRGRLVAADRLAQPGLDRAIALAVAPPGSSAMAHLPDADGRRCFLQIVPVGGRARDVFLGTAAVAVLIDPARQSHSATIDRTLIGESLSLTNREVDVARLVAEGLNPPEIARLLRIQVGTARDHLKSIFEKTGTRRQSELAALLGRLRP